MANFVVKVVDGKPVIFGSAGKDTGVPCYVFEDEEAYDAAMAEGLVPVGSLIFKTYDGAEMAGGPFDTELGDSDNAVQNRVVKAAIDRIDQSIAEALALRASLTGFGLAKICPLDLTDVTEDNGMVLGAVEKNASVSGSLANEINATKLKINDILFFISYATLEGGTAYIACERARESSVAIVNCIQGNLLYVIHTECQNGKIKVTVSEPSEGTTGFAVAIKI